MANNFSLIEKWLPNVVDTVFANESKTALLENGSKYIDINFKEAGYVKVLNILMDGLSDYYRVNHTGVASSAAYSHDNQNNGSGYRDGYRRGNTQATWEVFQLQYDRGKQFLVDAMDDEEMAGSIIANLLTEFLRVHVVPEIDALRFSKIAGKTNATLGNRVTETVASIANTILAKFDAAFEWLTEHEVPEEEQIIFVSAAVNTKIMGSSELTRYITQQDYTSEKGVSFKLNAYLGRPIIVVPSNRFYTDIVIGDNGYAPAAGSKVINYLICSKKAIIPIVKLQKSKVWSPETQDDFDGYKVNFRLYHDVIIPKNKVVGCYCSVSDVTASTKTAKVDLEMVEGSVQNAYAIPAFYTNPAGLFGTLVASASAITLGNTITVDGSTVFNVNVGGADNVDSTNTKLYFALLDSANKCIAISGQVTLVKKS